MSQRSAKILIVDDSFANRELLKEILRVSHPEYKFFFAEDGQQVLEKVEECSPDIILLDVMMPNMDGFEACKRLKANDMYKGLPILMITALDKVEQKITGLQLGAADYIVKPINEEETNARVEAHLRIKWFQDDLIDMNEKLARAQKSIVENAKMSAVGSLAAGVSHEFNNILTMMGGYTHLALKYDRVDELKEAVLIIDELVGRGKKIVKGLLDFSREDELYKQKEYDLKDMFEKDFLLMKKLFRDNDVELNLQLEDVPLMHCYAGQVSQVVLNLSKNAIEAMYNTEKKILTVKLYHEKNDSREKKEEHREHEQGNIIIEFIDSGPGIPEKLLDRIFEPFVTTKGVVSGGNINTPGTGLGLSIVFGIINRHEGTIRVESKQGEGARFIISLPVNPNKDEKSS